MTRMQTILQDKCNADIEYGDVMPMADLRVRMTENTAVKVGSVLIAAQRNRQNA